MKKKALAWISIILSGFITSIYAYFWLISKNNQTFSGLPITSYYALLLPPFILALSIVSLISKKDNKLINTSLALFSTSLVIWILALGLLFIYNNWTGVLIGGMGILVYAAMTIIGYILNIIGNLK